MCLGSSFQRLAGFDCTTGGLLKIGLKPRVLACCDLRLYPRVLIAPVRGSNNMSAWREQICTLSSSPL